MYAYNSRGVIRVVYGNEGELMRLFKSLLILFAIPAMITIINRFQDYADDNMTLNAFEQLIMDGWPFILIALAVLGIFMAIRRLGGKQ